jgi:hypothetical protein
MKQPALLAFKPRVLPRHGKDWAFSAVAMALLIPSLSLLFLLLAIGFYFLTAGSLTRDLSFFIPWFVWTAYGVLLPVLRLEFTPEGIRVVRLMGSRVVPWEEIERVEELSPAEFARQMLRPKLYTGRTASPGSLTFTDYVLIHHKGGSILFPPHSKEAFLHELRKHRERKETEQTQEAAKATPWYWTAQALREENQETLRSRIQK